VRSMTCSVWTENSRESVKSDRIQIERTTLLSEHPAATLRVIRGCEWERVFESDRIHIEEDDFIAGIRR